MVPSLNGQASLIPNGVDLEKYYIKSKKRDLKNIGYAGLMNEKKNPGLLLQIIKRNPDKTFHLRIDWQSPFWEEEYKRDDLKNVVYHGRYDNLADFWNQMSSVLSTSIIESFSFNIAEAMACGCKPYIYNWMGAKEIWHEQFIFEEFPEFGDHVDRAYYREYIKDNYPLNRSLEDMEKVMIGYEEPQEEPA